jgi:hypothetical protein
MRIAVTCLVFAGALGVHALPVLSEPVSQFPGLLVAQLSPQLPSAPSLTPSVPVPTHPTVQDPVAPVPAQPANPVPTVCTEQYVPVCGRVGTRLRSYSNACFARLAGAAVVAGGQCADASPSPN